MPLRISPALPLILLSLACVGAAAQGLKPGLWEINNKVKGSPQTDEAMARMQERLAAMPPEQRKQMEAMMAQRGMRMAPAGGGMTVQTCMTREMVERNEVPVRDGCTVTRHERSGNVLKMAFSCANPPSTGQGEFTFEGDQAYSSHMVVQTTMQGHAQTTEMDASGKWLGSDCGSVQPPMPRK